jgi:CheY-like chemotaxis protein
MNGFETSAEIRQIAPGIPVVMLTSDVLPGDAARRKEAGLSGYALKPVKRDDLLLLVCAAMKPRQDMSLQQSESVDRKNAEPVKAVRILIAEDSSDNRLLVQAYLKGSPHLLTFAEDGKVAVNRFAALEFDLVLMDMQMPVMDGLAATRAIREIERERGTASVPIIAVTANARRQDVEMSRDAGCTDHISKPISKHKLLSIIEEYRAPMKALEIPEKASLEPIAIEIPLDLEDIVPGYLVARRMELPVMIELLAVSDFKSLAALGHNLKGTGASYGFPELTRIGTSLERSAKVTDSIAVSKQLAELTNYLDRVELLAKV